MATSANNEVHSITPQVHVPQKSKKNLGSFTFKQELKPFGKWTSEPIWVPPKDNSSELAKSMLNRFSPFASKKTCWEALVHEHRSQFTQVREIELPKESIRLPQGRLYVTVTERKDFDKIEDPIPNCVQTRLEEFLQDHGKKRGVKVYYLKPLCVEVDDQLIFTTEDELNQAISQVQSEVFSQYRRLYLGHRTKRFANTAVNASLAIPRTFMRYFLERKKREIEAYHAKLEFERRKRALRATRAHQKLRTDGCTFEEMLSFMDPPDRKDVIDQYVAENELSNIDRQVFLIASAATLPWFIGLSIGLYQLAVVSLTTTMTVAVCDPAFVAEMPGSDGTLLKIGHFDEVDGVMHVEI